LVAVSVLMLAVSASWASDLTASLPWLGRSQWPVFGWRGVVGTDEAKVRARWEKLVVREGDTAIVLTATDASGGGEVFAPTFARVRVKQQSNLGTTMDYLSPRGARWGEAAALRLAGLAKNDTALGWEIGIGRFAEGVAALRQTPEVLGGTA